MSLGVSVYTANKILDAIFNNTSFAVAQAYIKLHVGDPGAAGTSNPATETTRKAASMAAAASGSIANDTAINWASIAGSEDATHFSVWDTVGPAGGNFLGSGLNTAGAYTAGDSYNVDIGDLTLGFTVAA